MNLNAHIEISMAKRSKFQESPERGDGIRHTTAGGVEYRFHVCETGVVVQRCERAGPPSRMDLFTHFHDVTVFSGYARGEERRLADKGLAKQLVVCFEAVAGRSCFGDGAAESFGLDYAIRALNIVQRIHASPDQVRVLDLMHQATRAIGADGSLYVSFIPEPGSTPTMWVLECGDLAGLIAGSSADLVEGWMGSARSFSEPVMADNLLQSSDLPGQLPSLGTRPALLVPMPSGGDRLRFAVMGFVSLSEGLFEAEHAGLAKLLARSLAAEVNGWWFRESGAALKRDARLDAVDLRLLAIQLAGRTDAQIAEALNVMPATVIRRWRSLERRLACADRREALRRAVEYGLVQADG